MGIWLLRARMLSLSCIAGAAYPAGEPGSIIDINNQNLNWRFHRNHDATCVISGTAISEMRDDAFEVQFRHSRGQQLKLFVLIPGLPRGGSVFMESPTTHDRWKIFTENYVPALAGEQAAALQRNVAAGIPLMFTFEFGNKHRVKYETISRGSVVAANAFRNCADENLIESLKAETK